MKRTLLLLIITFFTFTYHTFAKNEINKLDSVQSKDTTSKAKDSLIMVYMYIPEDSPKKVITMKPTSSNFTYIFPIITLVLGIFLNKLWDYSSARSKSSKVGKRWIAELRFLETPINQQIDALDAYLRSQTDSTFEIQEPAIYASLDCEIFKTLDKSELLRYLEIKKTNYAEAVKTSNSTHGYINILMHTYESLKEKFEAYLSESSNLTRSFSNNLGALRMAYADYGVELEKKNGGQDPVSVHSEFAQLTTLMGTHIVPLMQSGEYNPFEMQQNFFGPFLMILSSLRLDDDAKPLTKLTSSCLTDIAGLRMERRYLEENFTIILDRYRRSLSELSTVVDNLEK